MTTPPDDTNSYAYLQTLGTLFVKGSQLHVIVDADEVIVGHPPTDALEPFLAAWQTQGGGKWPKLRTYELRTHVSGLVMPIHWHLLADIIAKGATLTVTSDELTLQYPPDKGHEFVDFVQRCKAFGLTVTGTAKVPPPAFPMVAGEMFAQKLNFRKINKGGQP